MDFRKSSNFPSIGVGLRHAHFSEVLSEKSAIDFVEVHSENFFAKGGALHQILRDVSEIYPVSFHSTAMGLGSASGVPDAYLAQLETLTNVIDPFLMSDHASFAWSTFGEIPVHAGDLLPITFNDESLRIMEKHVDQIQQRFGRQLLIENLSSYLDMPGATMSDVEFLVNLTEKTGCGLLVDLNNILVNEFNQSNEEHIDAAKYWLDQIPGDVVGELHLAGFTKPGRNEMAVDDHSQPVSEDCWSLYRYALKKFGAIPTLIEWDNQLPAWEILVDQASKARMVAEEVLSGD